MFTWNNIAVGNFFSNFLLIFLYGASPGGGTFHMKQQAVWSMNLQRLQTPSRLLIYPAAVLLRTNQEFQRLSG